MDAILIKKLKASMPLKYWVYRISEWVSRIGLTGFIYVFITYFFLGAFIQHSGDPIPDFFVDGSVKSIIILLSTFIIGSIVKGALFTELKKA
ncbi:MAG TPA: hypothetical protein DEF05_00700 [Erwinia sp.]|nr:hypothetical protein [Erwinia sp.]